ncbi:MAG TPA: hypothetical protein PKE06_03075 [Flavilitoribacter sp.]|nr:hypothetical protein [Flavilitoribacter sp.]HMQ86419.1 hypothetical protein [Flavilitoribacter sp.]
MWRSIYPQVYYRLLLLFCILGAIHFIYNPEFTQGDGVYGMPDLVRYLELIEGGAFIFGGWLSLRIRAVKMGLFGAAFVMLVGQLILKFPVSPISWTASVVLFSAGYSFIYIHLLVHTATLFPIANDRKDFAYVLLIVLGELFKFLFSMINQFLTSQPGLPTLLLILFYVLLFWLIAREQDIGFSIETESEEEPEQPINLLLPIVMAIIFLFGVLTLNWRLKTPGYEHLTDSLIYGAINRGINIFFISNLIALGLLFIAIKNWRERAGQLTYILGALAVLLFFAVVGGGNSWDFYFLSILAHSWVWRIFFLGIAVSVICHAGFDASLGLKLGLFFGLMNILNFGIIQLIPDPTWGRIALILTIAPLIILIHENRKLLTAYLKLDEPAFEVEIETPKEDAHSDPFNHLIT